ncbi:MAG TPA: nickel-dependent lactate racemase [Gemmatimonadales bacterium]|jgi:nickel-dependent lactate racemase
MVQQVVPYGSGHRTFALPRGRLVARLEPLYPRPQGTAADLVAEALRDPIGSRPLRDLASGKRSAAILIPGKARVAGTQAYVPALIAELNAAGMPDREIEVYLADGTHEQHLESDILALLGKELAARVHCLGHDCRNEKELVQLGTTSYGTPVLFNRRVLAAEVKILTGRIVPHYFAGFSGGRKALLPGVAGFRTILANHRLTLGPERGIHPLVAACSLDGNPVHEDMLEAARMARPEFCLNTVFDARDRMVAAVAGDFEAAHEEGCRRASALLRMTLPEPVDALITSAGGHPYDHNFMQSLKAVFNVRDIVRPGGAVLWLAECPSGINPGFLPWAEIESDGDLEAAIRSRYALTGHNSLMLRQLVRRAEVALMSALAPEVVSKLGMHPVASLEKGLEWLLGRFAGDFTYAVVPYANVMCATIDGVTGDPLTAGAAPASTQLSR